MSKLRQVTGAHSGLGEWSGQLLSALIMIALIVYLVIAFAVVQPFGHFALSSFVGANYIRVPAVLLAFVVVWHAWLGAKSILMDYIKWNTLRVVKYIGTIVYLLVVLIWFIAVIWSV